MSIGKGKMGIILDTSQPGLTAILKPYMAEILLEMWRIAGVGGSLSLGSMTSGEADAFCKKHDIRASPEAKRTVSRASLILGLNKLVEDGIIDYREKTGKGGFHRVYYPATDPKGFEKFVISKFVQKCNEIFEGEWWKEQPA